MLATTTWDCRKCAAAFSHLIDAVLPPNQNYPKPNIGAVPPKIWPWTPSSGGGPIQAPIFVLPVVNNRNNIADELNAIRSLLRPRPASAVNPPVLANPYPETDWWEPGKTESLYSSYLVNNVNWPGGGPIGQRFAQVLHDELCLQRQTDLEWRPVVEQMTAGCLSAAAIFNDTKPPSDLTGCLPLLLDRALDYFTQATAGLVPFDCEANAPRIPRNFEESLEDIADTI